MLAWVLDRQHRDNCVQDSDIWADFWTRFGRSKGRHADAAKPTFRRVDRSDIDQTDAAYFS